MDADTRSTPDRPPTAEYQDQYWSKMDSLFFRTIGQAEQTFRINMYINILVAGFGSLLLLLSIWSTLTRGVDIMAGVFGVLGVGSFLGYFYVQPLQRIQRTVADLTQIQIFYRTYCAQWDNIQDWQRSNKDHMTLQELESLNKQLEERTLETVRRIEEYVGEKTK